MVKVNFDQKRWNDLIAGKHIEPISKSESASLVLSGAKNISLGILDLVAASNSKTGKSARILRELIRIFS